MIKIKNTTRVIIYSILLTILAFIVTYYESLLPDSTKIYYLIFIPLWFFSLIPAYVFAIAWLNTKTFEEGVRIGLIWETTIYIIPLLIAPILMIIYYYKLIKNN